MPFSTLPPYEPGTVDRRGEHAVVVGASMAGLLAGRALADAYDRVTILDRDPLPERAQPRRSTPQAEHVHVLLEAGRATLESLLPGYGDALEAAGGLVLDSSTELALHEYGDYLADGDEPLPMACASRPLFERVTREHVAAVDDVTLLDETRCTDYLVDDQDSTVHGVVTTDCGASAQDDADHVDRPADLVVDATGRTSRTPDWLARHGYDRPREDEVTVDLAYSTTTVERPPEDRRAFLVVPTPPNARGGSAIPIEDDRWVVTLFGLHDDHPPATADGLLSFAEDLPASDVHDLLATQKWSGDDVRQYPFASSLRRRYEDLDAFPDGLLVTGDAVASFNPIYGQGMSAAALDALALHRVLADAPDSRQHGTADEPLASRYFDRIAEHRDVIWQMAVSADFEFDATTGPRPFGTAISNRYLSRLVRTAHADSALATAYAQVLRLERPPKTLFEPRILWRVLRPNAARTPR
jgi:2-polyprenyl-6-methoxyphenol hydroxylase-like FAD-dependent oxidoreductase